MRKRAKPGVVLVITEEQANSLLRFLRMPLTPEFKRNWPQGDAADILRIQSALIQELDETPMPLLDRLEYLRQLEYATERWRIDELIGYDPFDRDHETTERDIEAHAALMAGPDRVRSLDNDLSPNSWVMPMGTSLSDVIKTTHINDILVRSAILELFLQIKYFLSASGVDTSKVKPLGPHYEEGDKRA